ncbi:DUF58 domain-containing protein [Algisphaera agarilytica]|uniref:Uncharacterized protein (DUF58 family) n=1 Tax=Algisphaera agarilytica TaxID=1385975 RepID=A0A7X0LKE4_9BACT|nr:DUF58 domain-containing protein [Algisphaera agarilytica]MBB6429556.1 uncharacterized protein (DUF58 family) [Algisphaera agarilytica]
MPSTATPSRYLNPAELAPLRHLVFASRRAVVGHYAGKHASPQRGHSVEFQDYRDYSPGDPLGEIDWKVYGRSDKLFIKLFEHQSDMTVNLLVDGSASMGYRGLGGLGAEGLGQDKRKRRRFFPSPQTPKPPTSKYDHACATASAIAYLVTQQQDKVGLGIAQQGLQHSVRAAGTYPHLHRLVGIMESVAPQGPANLAAAIHAAARQAKRKGMLLIFSDLQENQGAVLKALSHFLHRGHEVIVFHTLHADELKLPDLSEAVFVDSESGREVRVNVEDIRADYEAKMHARVDQWRRVLMARGVDYNLVSTATPYHETLRQYLFSRASLM